MASPDPLRAQRKTRQSTHTAKRMSERRQYTLGFLSQRRLSDTVVESSGLSTDVLQADTVVGGIYRIISVIGAGGMGVVYLAQHIAMKRMYALKVLAPELVNKQSWLRFKSEAKVLGALSHPALVHVYDLGIDNGTVPFYAMDYIEGRNLEDILCDRIRLDLRETISLFLLVLDGLAYAHKNGVVHRDIKPANILVYTGENGEIAIKILDFGISKFMVAERAQNLTAIGETFGSPYYMSPEQCLGQPVDATADIYSVGCSLFETLTGYVPFEGETPLDTALMQQEDEPPLLRDLYPENKFPPALDLVLGKCLAKNSSERYQSAQDLSADLIRVLEGKALSAAAGPFPVRNSRMKTTPMEASQSTSSGAFVFVSLLAILVAGLAVTLWVSVLHESKVTRRNMDNVVVGPDRGAARLGAERPAKEVKTQGAERVISSSGLPTQLGPGKDPLEAAMTPLATSSKTLPDEPSSIEMSDLLSHTDDIIVKFNRLPEDSPASRLDRSYYSSIVTSNNEKVKLFKFPTDAFLGCIYSDQFNDRCAAQGDVKVALRTRTYYCPSRLAVRFPQYLKRFRPGEIAGIRLLSFANDDQILAAISQMTDVASLRLIDCRNISAKGVAALKNFRKIDYFDGSGMDVNAAVLARSRDWSELDTLGYNNSRSATPWLAALKSSKALRVVHFNRTPITEYDCEVLGQLPGLKILDLGHADLTAGKVERIARSHSIQELHLENCTLNQDGIDRLKMLHSLKILQIGHDASSRTREALIRSLPGVRVI